MKKVYLDQMILTTCCPTTAGSKMLDGYVSPFAATVVEKLTAAGITVGDENGCKVAVGEFAIDLAGETDASASDVTAKSVLENGADAVLMLDVNGAPRRIAAQKEKGDKKWAEAVASKMGIKIVEE